MAVFFLNNCKFNGCGKTFPSLSNLIEHIEAAHIDFDPKVVAEFEQQRPSSLPLSYVLKYSHCRQRKGTTSIDIRIRLLQHASKVALERNNSLENEMEEEEIISESESSNDSWTPSKGVHLHGRKMGGSSLVFKDKPYACSVPGCKKRYKNVNGIKYHCKNGHKTFQKSKKAHKQMPKKKDKRVNFKVTTDTFFKGEPAAVKSSCVATVDLLPTSENCSINHKWNSSGKNDNEVVVNEQMEKELHKNAATQEHSDNNNKLCAVDCTSTCMNVYTQWSGDNFESKTDVTIIRPSMQNNEVPQSNVEVL